MLWQTYFDNHPHGDYGTIKQQWWALAHFFLHLGYVGVVEGSNQLAICKSEMLAIRVTTSSKLPCHRIHNELTTIT